MAEHSKIEWTDATWNHIVGCTVVSPGCTNCYAMRLAGTRMASHPSRQGLTTQTKAGPVWNGQVRLLADKLTEPLRWKRPRRIFVCAHGDLFHESVPDEWIDKTFAVMSLAPQHTFQVLTKRSARMRSYLCDSGRLTRIAQIMAMRGAGAESMALTLPLPNVWLGVSAEDQRRADERIPDLLATPAAVRWVSAEPLLGPLDLSAIDIDGDFELNAISPLSWREVWSKHWSPEATGVPLDEAIEAYRDEGGVYPPTDERPAHIDWVVTGGESGPNARPMHPDWARSLRDQCRAAGVAFHFKQWGEFLPLGAIPALDDCDIDAIMNADERRSEIVCGNGKRWNDADGQPPDDAWMMERVGKSRAGRLLDGVTHDEYPSAPSHSGRRG